MEDETTILNHYNLTTLYPTSWPTEKDDSDGSDEESTTNQRKIALRRSKSRYSALERSGSDRRSLVPGSERRNGIENLVQKDEPDPLSGAESVVRILKERGLPVEEDTRLRIKVHRCRHKDVLMHPREPLFTVFNHVLTPTLPLSSPLQCFHTVLTSRP